MMPHLPALKLHQRHLLRVFFLLELRMGIRAIMVIALPVRGLLSEYRWHLELRDRLLSVLRWSSSVREGGINTADGHNPIHTSSKLEVPCLSLPTLQRQCHIPRHLSQISGFSTIQRLMERDHHPVPSELCTPRNLRRHPMPPPTKHVNQETKGE
jgi:hypothetical protein